MAYISKVTVDNSDYDISATKLKNARTISLVADNVYTNNVSFDGTQNVAIPVNVLPQGIIQWRGESDTSISAVAGAYLGDFNANRLAYLNPSAILVERSTNAGQTWAEYEVTDAQKTNLTIYRTDAINNGNTKNSQSVNNWHRITISAMNDNQTSSYIYCRLNAFMIDVSTSGATGCKVLIERQHLNESDWETVGTHTINGWPGWNVIPIYPIFSFGSANTLAENYAKLRFTFSQTGINPSYDSNLSVRAIRLIAAQCYSATSSTLANKGTLYDYDYNKNATFPANVTATSFIGNVTGNVSGTASRATADASGNNIVATYAKKDEMPTITYTSSTETLNITT